MRVSRRRAREIGTAVVHEIRAEKLTFMAGSIAYHAFISILPLLLLVLTVVQQLQNVALEDSVVSVMQAVLTEQSSDLIQQGLADADASVSLLGVAFLVWGTLRIFRGLDTAFSDIYETEHENTFADQLGDGLLLLVTVALAILLASAVGSLVTVRGDGALATLLRALATAAGLFIVLYPMYYVFPDSDVSLVEVVPGTAFAAVGITVAQVVFTAFKSGGSGANLVASILVLLTWLYVVGLLVLVGAAVNAVLSNRSRDVDIEPVFGGVERDRTGRVTRASRDELVADLERLATSLEGEDATLTVTVDGETVAVEAPESAVVEEEDGLFGVGGSVGLELRWWPDD
ncbi:YhjD/YihY/BrkB family envelope integrity protein [Haloarchaeobius baliensis]|uniref:YhjD/YihY/BrkB family envelope integrity protein n=1 Tax=Haloarchaeobius baliensis TaxID=1670458 RepID=UPI003F880673